MTSATEELLIEMRCAVRVKSTVDLEGFLRKKRNVSH